MMNNTNNDEKKRREVWIALLGALFLGSFLLFGGCQAQLLSGVNAAAQGSLFPVTATPVPATATPQPTTTATPQPTATATAIPTATAVPITPTVAARIPEAPLVVPFVKILSAKSKASSTRNGATKPVRALQNESDVFALVVAQQSMQPTEHY